MHSLLRKAAAALALGAVIVYVDPISAADTSAPPESRLLRPQRTLLSRFPRKS